MRVREAAKKLWSEDIPVPIISEELGIPVPTIWRWRYQDRWPRRNLRASYWNAVVAQAVKAWDTGLLRAEIASRYNVSLSTLGNWRVRYHWEKRSPGRRAHGTIAPDPEFRQQEQPKERAELREQHIAAARQRFRKTLPRWRCCDRLLDVPVCPECHRRIPVCA